MKKALAKLRVCQYAGVLKAFWVTLPALWFALPRFALCAESRLEEMAREADLVFKGQVLSSARITNTGFHNPQMDVHATKLKLISILNGSVAAREVLLQHYTTGPGAWSGAHWPPYYRFEVGQSYLIFAASLDKPDKYFSPVPGEHRKPDEFRQIADFPTRDDEGVLRTLDSRPLGSIAIKDAHWFELNLLLKDTNQTNQLYAIDHLDWMSRTCAHPWGHSDDFKRAAVLKVLSPMLTNANDAVAVAAISCFRVGSECSTQILPHASTLIQIATSASSVSRRALAVATFVGTKLDAARSALPNWLNDPAAEVRAQTVSLLVDFPGELSEQMLRKRATDNSPAVRSAVAEAIGKGKLDRLLPTLVELLADSSSIPPLAFDDGQGGGRSFDTVHGSAGYALLKFDIDQVRGILKANLNDAEFRPNFLCKLAEKDAGPWLKDMAEVMESRRTRMEKKAESSGVEPKAYYFQALMALSGTYFNCWNIIYNHLHELPKEEFAEGKLDRYLNVLENAGNTGSQEPTKLYELYRLNGLEKRAAEFRSKCEKTFSYDMSIYFNRVDSQFTNRPAISDR